MELRTHYDDRLGYDEHNELCTSRTGARHFRFFVTQGTLSGKHSPPITLSGHKLKWDEHNRAIRFADENTWVGVNADAVCFSSPIQGDTETFTEKKHCVYVYDKYISEGGSCSQIDWYKKEPLMTKELNEGTTHDITVDTHGQTTATVKMMCKRLFIALQSMANSFGFSYSVRLIIGGKLLPQAVREVVAAFQLSNEELKYGMIVKVHPKSDS